jgi:hypothetical protein
VAAHSGQLQLKDSQGTVHSVLNSGKHTVIGRHADTTDTDTRLGFFSTTPINRQQATSIVSADPEELLNSEAVSTSIVSSTPPNSILEVQARGALPPIDGRACPLIDGDDADGKVDACPASCGFKSSMFSSIAITSMVPEVVDGVSNKAVITCNQACTADIKVGYHMWLPSLNGIKAYRQITKVTNSNQFEVEPAFSYVNADTLGQTSGWDGQLQLMMQCPDAACSGFCIKLVDDGGTYTKPHSQATQIGGLDITGRVGAVGCEERCTNSMDSNKADCERTEECRVQNGAGEWVLTAHDTLVSCQSSGGTWSFFKGDPVAPVDNCLTTPSTGCVRGYHTWVKEFDKFPKPEYYYVDIAGQWEAKVCARNPDNYAKALPKADSTCAHNSVTCLTGVGGIDARLHSMATDISTLMSSVNTIGTMVNENAGDLDALLDVVGSNHGYGLLTVN